MAEAQGGHILRTSHAVCWKNSGRMAVRCHWKKKKVDKIAKLFCHSKCVTAISWWQQITRGESIRRMSWRRGLCNAKKAKKGVFACAWSCCADLLRHTHPHHNSVNNIHFFHLYYHRHLSNFRNFEKKIRRDKTRRGKTVTRMGKSDSTV